MFRTLQSALYVAFAVIAAGAAGGCIREDLSNCPPPVPEELQIVVNILDAISGDNIPVTDNISDGALFVFDANKQLIHYQIVPQEDLGKEKTIPIPDASTRAAGDEIYIAAWGNVAKNMVTPDNYNMGENIGGTYLDMLSDADRENYMMCPGEMFFGLHAIDPTLLADSVHTVQVSQINARLMVTVRGLPAGADAADYYFNLERLSDGYAFDGTPLNNDRRHIREAGVFIGNGDFVSPEPYYLIPSVDPANIDADSGMVLHLMQVAPTRAGEDIDLTGQVTQDMTGAWIALYPGQTTNVLIDFSKYDTAGMVVRMEITPWNEIYQWTEWN